MVKENDCVDIAELSRRFEVSQMTIHRDLRELEESGEVSRVYGGAKAVARQEAEPDAPQDDTELLHTDLPIEDRFKRSLEFKRAIAAKAAALVEDGDVIAMDPSTTTLHMCSYLKDRRFSVVTPSLSVALQCSNMKNVQVILLGGNLRKSSLSVVGTQMNEMLDWMVINKCFLSSHAFSYKTGLTDFTMDEAAVKRNLIASSQKVYVLVDHTKIDREASYVACNYRNIDTIFTDSEKFMDERQRECLRKYEAAGVEVVYSM
jgi:DeoR/GlpR family transcriptional regulator of sugar metabolism